MKQALFILAVALYLVSLCACGNQKIQSKSKQDSATQQVVQEQMANATGETSAPPTAIRSRSLRRKHPFRSRSRRSLPKRSRITNRLRPPKDSTSI